MDLNKFNCNLNPLSDDEMQKIVGGESAWYWVAYTIGYTGRMIQAFGQSVHWASETMPGLK